MFKQSILALGLTLSTAAALSQPAVEYEVTITNITPGQTFTDQLVVVHPGSVQLFELGAEAGEPLEILAEGGNPERVIQQVADVAMDVDVIPGLLAPGETASTLVTGHPSRGYISLAAMLIPTNDTFVALNKVRLPRSGTATYMVPAYDAGTEINDQNCLNMPGPVCGGEGYSDEPGEGFVHIGNGFHELGDDPDVLGPQVYDWRNSVARITVRRTNR